MKQPHLILELKEAVEVMPLSLAWEMPLLRFADYHAMKHGESSVIFSAIAPYHFMFGQTTGRIFVDPIFFEQKNNNHDKSVLVYYLDEGKTNPILTEFFRDAMLHPHMWEMIPVPKEYHLNKIKYLIKFHSAILLPGIRKPVILKYKYDVRLKLNQQKATIENYEKAMQRIHGLRASARGSI